jgi:hypothetical protein
MVNKNMTSLQTILRLSMLPNAMQDGVQSCATYDPPAPTDIGITFRDGVSLQ